MNKKPRIKRRRPRQIDPIQKPITSAIGGRLCFISNTEIKQIAEAALTILEKIGISNYSNHVKNIILQAGGSIERNRLFFPRDLVLRTIEKAPGIVQLFGQSPEHNLDVGGNRSFTGSGGAAPNILDLNTGRYRVSTLRDLYHASRICDSLDHIHFFSRSLVARDITDPCAFDVNTAFAALAGTTKHVMISASEPGNVKQIAKLCYLIAGSEEVFRSRPFASFNINHAVPPLRFHEESTAVMAEAIKAGFPVHANVFGQLGASSPVTVAGSVAQTLAETLAGITFGYSFEPNAKIIAGPRPMLTDLRTGGFSGGSGEQAVATAICAQVFRYWDLPCSVIAGATDSKRPDAQAGYEKALNITTALQAGANLITQACGMHAGLMGVSFESYIIDNDMLGSILRSGIPPEVNQSTLALKEIQDVINGDGHFLGQPETYARMRTDFLYPEIANRLQINEWQEAGSPDLVDTARDKVNQILNGYFPNHIDPLTEQKIRASLDIRLPKADMRPNKTSGES